MAKTIFHSMSNVLLNKRVKLDTRIMVLRCYVWSVLLYGCEAWKDNAKETAGSRDVVFEKDAENLVDGKKQSGSTEHGRGWSSTVGNTP